ncbi:MAG TPA: DinB family protein [Longimicrobium sp.]|nr:DinB family protein [Longimicrobium sp.]
METLPREMVMEAIGAILTEAYEGPPDPSGTWFVNNAADAGFFPTLDGLSADEASRAAAPGRSTVAAHAGHIRFGLEVSRRWVSGNRGPYDWHQSWAVSTVDEAAWAELRAGLRQEYAAFRRAIDEVHEWEESRFTGLLGNLAHAAYHLGAVKQMVLEMRGSETTRAETAGARG